MADYYKILGIDKSATQADIKKAYLKLSLKFHPDKNDGDAFFENMFKQILEAYETLGNEERRKGYDNQFESEPAGYKTYSQQTYAHHQQNYYKQSHQSVGIPVIEEFISDKLNFYSGEIISFEWRTNNADVIRLIPFGAVEPNGSKSYRLDLKKENQEYINITLEATNLSSGKTVTKNIKLKNKLFFARDNSQEAKRAEETFVKYGGLVDEKFFSVKGRLRRSSYFFRGLLLSFVSVIMGAVADGARDEGVSGIVGLIIIICGVLFTIQTIKRLHDTNYSGWHVVWSLVPFACFILGLHALFSKGTQGPNNYGGDPRLKLAR